jgi:hypothetical protein
MREGLILYLPWLLSCGTISTYAVIGKKLWWGWLIGLATQAVWFIWIPLSGSWGLMPTTLFLTVIQGWNLVAWKRVQPVTHKSGLEGASTRPR